MSDDRRSDAPLDTAALRDTLLPAQQEAVSTLEQLGWELRFVRRPMFHAPVPVVFEKRGQRWLVVTDDGRLDEDPGFEIRE